MTFKMLTEDELETLELLMGDHWPLILKVVSIAVEVQRERISTTAVEKESDLFQLGMERKKYEGAFGVQLYLESLKRKKEKKNANR